MSLVSKERRWWLFAYVFLAFIMGAALHREYDHLRRQPPPEVNRAPVVQVAPPIKPPTKPKTKR